MSAGDGRHHRVDEVMPRHFVETAARGGMGEEAVEAVFADLLATAPSALDGVARAMPSDLPDELTDSIAAGFTRRLDRLAGR